MKHGISKTEKKWLDTYVDEIMKVGDTVTLDVLIRYVSEHHAQVNITKQSASKWCQGKGMERAGVGVWKKIE